MKMHCDVRRLIINVLIILSKLITIKLSVKCI